MKRSVFLTCNQYFRIFRKFKFRYDTLIRVNSVSAGFFIHHREADMAVVLPF